MVKTRALRVDRLSVAAPSISPDNHIEGSSSERYS